MKVDLIKLIQVVSTALMQSQLANYRFGSSIE